MAFYDDMQQLATELLSGEFKQGVIRLWRQGAPTGPSYAPQPGAPTYFTMPGAVCRGVEAQYVQEGDISQADQQVTASVFGTEPEISDKLEVDGDLREIIKVERIPAAGTLVCWKIFIKG
ncbi:MAG TPA: hypothetical protein VGP45_03895 [Marinobacter sp.]|nr:hypothetical protein [Marinobacter sp.]